MVEPMEGVRLSATINNVASEIHGVSAYHCTNWHIFTVIVSISSFEGVGQGRKGLRLTKEAI